MTTDLDLDELERLAREATPGPWAFVWAQDGRDSPTSLAVSAFRGKSETLIAESGVEYDKQDISDFDYIAAMNPSVALALIERVRRAEGYQMEQKTGYNPRQGPL